MCVKEKERVGWGFKPLDVSVAWNGVNYIPVCLPTTKTTTKYALDFIFRF